MTKTAKIEKNQIVLKKAPKAPKLVLTEPPQDKENFSEKDSLDKLTTKNLTSTQRAVMHTALQTCETQIELAGHNLRQSEWEIGSALRRIKEERLFLAKGFEDFKSYLLSKTEWKMTPPSAYNYIHLTRLTKEQVAQIGISASFVVGQIPDDESREKVVSKLTTALQTDMTAKKAVAIARKLADDAREEKGITKKSPGRTPRQSTKTEPKNIITPTGRVGMKTKFVLDLKEIANEGGWDQQTEVVDLGPCKIQITVNEDKCCVRIDVIS